MGKRPSTNPGVTNVCFLPSFVPPAHAVELISISGQSFPGVWFARGGEVAAAWDSAEANA